MNVPWQEWLAGFLAAGGVLGRFRLRTRFVIVVIASVIVCGGVNLVLVDAVAARVLKTEVEGRATALGRRLADDVSRSLLREDPQALRASLAAMTRVDRGVDYVLVIDREGGVIASTFSDGVPLGLRRANVPRGDRVGSVLIRDRAVQYRDVAVPLLAGELGFVRLGARLDHIDGGLSVIRLAIGAMVLVFMLVGLVGAYATAYVINAPIERLVRFARTFDPARPTPARLAAADRGELGELVRSFDAMAGRLVQLHADREQFQARIVRAERLATVGALAAGIAHEVNNPLAGITNCLRAVAREPEDVEQTRAYAEMMLEAAHSIGRTVRALMDSAARRPMDAARVDLRALVDRLDLLVRPRFAAAGVRLEVDLPDDLPAFTADAGVVQQILVNLLLNAGDASPRGAAVTLRVRGIAPGVRFEVLDRGHGIAESIRDRIFTPFVTTKAESGGTGLGLAMVRAQVQEVDGEVSFAAREGGGTAFVVTLPSAPTREGGAVGARCA